MYKRSKKEKPKAHHTRSTSKRRVVAVVSDAHVGSTLGLWPKEGFALEDGQRILPNKIQLWLWDSWLGFWAEVKRRAGAAPVIGVMNGEYIDGNHHNTTQLMTPSLEIQRDAACEVFRIPRAMCAEWYSVRGTEAHAGKGGQDDDAVARALRSERDPETGRYSFYHLSLDVGPLRLDVAHHISTTTRPWTRGTNIRAEVLSMALDSIAGGRTLKLPDLVIRSHVHQHIDTHDMFPLRGIVTPAWQYKTAYGHRITRARRFVVGGLIVVIDEREGYRSWQADLWTRTLPDAPAVKSNT